MYPKDYYAEANLSIDTGLCFVLMPFAPKFDEVWDVIRNTVGGPPFNLLCRRADDIARPGHILTDVLENIGRARLLIADLSGQNPNVFYELGVAHSIKGASEVILISADLESVPFDLRHLRTIVYHNDYGKLRDGLSTVFNEIGIKQYAVVLKEGESGRIPARLTGDDRCLYEIEIKVDYAGDDGVKFELRTFRYVAGLAPFMATNDGHYLGMAQPALKVPGIPWSLCYSRTPEGNVRFILGRPTLANAGAFE
jgi:hypothetical protein